MNCTRFAPPGASGPLGAGNRIRCCKVRFLESGADDTGRSLGVYTLVQVGRRRGCAEEWNTECGRMHSGAGLGPLRTGSTGGQKRDGHGDHGGWHRQHMMLATTLRGLCAAVCGVRCADGVSAVVERPRRVDVADGIWTIWCGLRFEAGTGGAEPEWARKCISTLFRWCWCSPGPVSHLSTVLATIPAPR